MADAPFDHEDRSRIVRSCADAAPPSEHASGGAARHVSPSFILIDYRPRLANPSHLSPPSGERVRAVSRRRQAEFLARHKFEQSKNTTKLHQRGYIESILSRYGMLQCKPVSTPLELNTKLRKSEEDSIKNGEKLPFRELIGSLMYLATATRPDIAHAVSVLSQFNNCYDRTHWGSAKRILRYLRGTSDLGLVYRASEEQVKGYVDADWANCPEDRRSFTGYCFLFGGATISWESKKQKTVALSSVEAEYMGLSEAAKASIYLRRFLTELGFGGLANIILHCDNQGAIRLAKNPIFHNRTKHIDVRHHFVRNALEGGEFILEYLPTDEMIADVLTKGVPGPRHVRLSNSLGLSNA